MLFRSRAFNTWSKWEPCDRTTENLLKMLDFDFFELLDSVTIARSRKHIQKYYDTSAIGTFPTRLKPISLRPHLTDLKDAINYNEIFEQLVVFRFFFLPVMPCHRQGIPALLLPQAIEELTAELVVVKEAVDVRAPGQAVFPGCAGRALAGLASAAGDDKGIDVEIGRASCRERV